MKARNGFWLALGVALALAGGFQLSTVAYASTGNALPGGGVAQNLYAPSCAQVRSAGVGTVSMSIPSVGNSLTGGLDFAGSACGSTGAVTLGYDTGIGYLTQTGANGLMINNSGSTSLCLLSGAVCSGDVSGVWTFNSSIGVNGTGAITGNSTGQITGFTNVAANNSVTAATNVVVSSAGTAVTLQNGSITTGSGSPFGSWGGMDTSIASGSVFGSYPVTSGTNLGGFKFGGTSCFVPNGSGAVGTGTAGTLIIKDVTGASTLCTPFSGNFNCALAKSTPSAIGACNVAPTAGHVYGYVLTGCTTFPTQLSCTTDETH